LNATAPDKILHSHNKTNALLGSIIAVAIPFLFWDPLGLLRFRLTPLLWDLGHLLLFFAVGWLTLNCLHRYLNTNFILLFIGFNAVVFLIGLSIEEMQLALGRDYSFDDIYRNCLGISLALIFHPRTQLTNQRRRVTIRALSILPLLAVLLPITKNSIDLIAASLSFPVLSNFESAFERERWIGDDLESIELDGGNRVLAHRFDTTRYSSLSLKHFPGNWVGYRCLRYRIFNPAADSLPLTIRINDRIHDETGFAYDNRFNFRFEVASGWNDYVVDLNEVSNAPRARSMDMAEIAEVMFFTMSLDASATLYFDDIELDGQSIPCGVGANPQEPN